jgi:hypothetical protein
MNIDNKELLLFVSDGGLWIGHGLYVCSVRFALGRLVGWQEWR